MDTFVQDLANGVNSFFASSTAARSVIVLFVAIIAAYWISRFFARAIIRVAQRIAVSADSTSDEERAIQLRRVETYLSVTTALVRAGVVAVVAYFAWRFLIPDTNDSAAAIGAGTIFVVLAGGTIGMLLRDITTGATMIIERWFTVGDFIKVEPFGDVSGVVERATLRSTRLRGLNGEIIWLHNQQIQGVRVTPRGLRTEAVDIFVRDKEKGQKIVTEAMATIPTGTLMLAEPLRIMSIEEWGKNLWRIVVQGQTTPGREWLIEQYFIDALKECDDKQESRKVIIREPIVRYADPTAERKFKRAIRIARDQKINK
ncbi:MAG TPA: mechanosensitive ion channel family protein [Candidatus Saccharimonadales bacterium]